MEVGDVTCGSGLDGGEEASAVLSALKAEETVLEIVLPGFDETNATLLPGFDETTAALLPKPARS